MDGGKVEMVVMIRIGDDGGGGNMDGGGDDGMVVVVIWVAMTG